MVKSKSLRKNNMKTMRRKMRGGGTYLRRSKSNC